MANMAKQPLSLHHVPALVVRAGFCGACSAFKKIYYSFSAWMSFAPSLQASCERGNIEARNIEAG